MDAKWWKEGGVTYVVDFVECLLENGVSMKSFLTIATLEQLYNLDDDAQHSVRFLVEHTSPTTYLTLPDIGMIIEKLMGNAYKHYYTSRVFKNNYEKFRKKAQLSRLSSLHIRLVAKSAAKRRKSGDWLNPMQCEDDAPPDFAYPFNDLILWAVLTRRPEMAKCMWLHGEDAMAKSLVAARLYKAIARIAEEDYLEVEVAQKLREYCDCQRLLAELWHGSLRVRSGTNLRVLAALICPPAALALAYKVPHNPSRDQDIHSEESTVYDTMSTCRTDRPEGNSAGSMMSLHLHRLFKTASIRRKNVLASDELEELVENGAPKKVTMMSSKRSSGLHPPVDDLYIEESLSALAKMRAFYSAPITKFWSWCIAFAIFLMLSSYVLLIETPVNPTNIEYATLAYIVVYTVEHIRKLFDQETPKLREKCRVFYTKNIFYKPYFMLYGEVYAGEIDTWTNCVPGGWIPPVLMTIFLLVANILLINMLIAIFNNIFNDTNIRSHEVWLFQRYGQKKTLKTGKERDDVIAKCSTRLYLSAEELRELHDFEEDCMDELTRKRIRKQKGGAEDSWLNTLEITELTAQRVNELLQENCSLKSRLVDVEARLDLIIRTQTEFIDALTRRQKRSKSGSSRASTQSLPEADVGKPRRLTIAVPDISSVVMDQALLSPVPDRSKAESPLLNHLRMDHTLRKYDETRYQPASICRRHRLDSSSFSISQDMKDMDKSQKTSDGIFSDEEAPSVVVHEPWEDSS
ncbi:unnamed protein product [Haemonchus placei]|uniref:Ion_trans domain-containing protein n=1 Tax=Haemonchus placei TaxID=6290 RepID=A0A158QN18_HAEPC|nr:unnamed protein product [Haemonchus placei]